MRAKQLARPFELKAIDEKSGEFSGYGSVFDVVDWYRDVVIKGAFANSLAAKRGTKLWPKMLWQHRPGEPIGVWKDMKEDDVGLWCEGQLNLEMVKDGPIPANPRAWEAYSGLKTGALSGLSIGFDYVPGGYEYDQKRDAYILKQLDLWEVSPVTFPANEAAQIETVKAAGMTARELEHFLRDAGMSARDAKALLSGGVKALEQRDAADEELEQLKAMVRSNTHLIGG
jgi:uncharacterized protein